MTFKVVWSTDWHVADIGPVNRTDDYMETCFRKIEQIRLISEKIKADICLIGGDVFHVKTSSKVRHALVARLINTLKAFPCPVYSIVGNHDISHNNINTLPEKPLGVIFESGALRMLDDETFVKGDINVRIIGKHFDPKIELDAFDGVEKGDEDWLMLAYHGYASLQGVSYPGETTFRYSQLAQLPVDDWYFGHWHIDQGVTLVDGKNFVNVGSLTRGALNLENITRTPKVVLASYGKTTRKLQQIKLRIEPAAHVFNMARKERTDREQLKINMFVENLRKETSQKNAGKPAIAEKLAKYTLAKDVKDCVSTLLADAEVELATARAGR